MHRGCRARLLKVAKKTIYKTLKKNAKPLEPGLIALKRDAGALDELCISKKRNLWLWTAVSRYSGQILAFVLGDRREDNKGTT